jgi:hypothetical protein
MNTINDAEFNRIKNDCLYAKTFAHHQDDPQVMDILAKAGYINEPRTDMDSVILADMNILSLPVKSCVQDGRPTAIIVSTGSYSPVHAGHLGILEVARRHAESIGYQVVQGVLSASHDAYVSRKYGGHAKMHVGIRSQRILDAVERSSWLSLDRMEGEMLSCAVNFSTVLQHVREYLLAHHPSVTKDSKVFYVFGSDNAGFSEAFIGNDTYHGVCVARAGQSIDYAPHSNLHFIQHSEDFSHYSSTLQRSHMLEQPSSIAQESPGVYLVRTDGVPPDFASALTEIIQRYTAPCVEMRMINSRDFCLDKKGTISLDKYMAGEHNIDVSRVFELSGGQQIPYGTTSLSSSLSEQVKRVPAGDYTLVDDDSITGFTMNSVEASLAEVGVNVIARKTLIEQVIGNDRLFDIVDARDFLITAKKGGLVVRAGENDVRAPYLFPFVNVVTRAKIKAEYQHQFSHDVYVLNRLHSDNVNICDLEKPKADFMALLGDFKTVGAVCAYYIQVISNLLDAYSSLDEVS